MHSVSLMNERLKRRSLDIPYSVVLPNLTWSISIAYISQAYD